MLSANIYIIAYFLRFNKLRARKHSSFDKLSNSYFVISHFSLAAFTKLRKGTTRHVSQSRKRFKFLRNAGLELI